MTRGSLKGDDVYTVGDGCNDIQTCIDAQKAFNVKGKSPFLCSECYTGWLTHWSEGGANTSSSAPHVTSILAVNGSVSLYMVCGFAILSPSPRHPCVMMLTIRLSARPSIPKAHGGTNFGFWSGANGNGGSSYQPHETSYDYSSPIAEDGSHGYHAGQDKFIAMRDALASDLDALPDEPAFLPRLSFGAVDVVQRTDLFDNIDTLAPDGPASSGDMYPPFAESVGCHYGFVLYTHVLTHTVTNASVSFGEIKDRAQVFVNSAFQGTSYRVRPQTVSINGISGDTLQVLVENMGRINFGHGMDDTRKGIIGNVTLDGYGTLTGWTTTCLSMDPATLTSLDWHDVRDRTSSDGPVFFRTNTLPFDGKGDVGATNDTHSRRTRTPYSRRTSRAAQTFANMAGWGKGLAWANGFLLGRFWPSVGPQRTLYVPAPVTVPNMPSVPESLRSRFVVLELEAASLDLPQNFAFQDHPQLQ